MSLPSVTERLKRAATKNAWHKIGASSHHGINLSLGSLHSATSQGIGDFYDLEKLLPWCEEVGFDTVQLLPINDTESDPSPYNAISSLALHPIYLCLALLPFVDGCPDLQSRLAALSEMNKTHRVLYSDVLQGKITFIKEYVARYGKTLLSSDAVKTFIEKNKWLKPYALFKILKETMGPSHFMDWPLPVKSPTKEEYDKLLELHAEEIALHCLVQYFCYHQMSHVRDVALKKGIWIKGDIPILISQDSADVWHERELFSLDFCAGAPPDYYNKEGQYWGFPLYNWPVIRLKSFAWWKRRLSFASHFYDIYRLDHVIGFFRIWAIMEGRPAKEGKFIPEDESLWGAQGKEILSELCTFSDMLPIAEDLGLVPDVVPPTLASLGICSTKVMRWERNWQGDKTYIEPSDYPPISMTCLSTHDSPTLAQWWRDFPDEVEPLCKQKKWSYTPILSFEKRLELLQDSHMTASLFHINLLQEYLALIPSLIHLDINEERINIPGQVLPSNWTYRFKPSIEQLVAHQELKSYLQQMLPHKK